MSAVPGLRLGWSQLAREWAALAFGRPQFNPSSGRALTLHQFLEPSGALCAWTYATRPLESWFPHASNADDETFAVGIK